MSNEKVILSALTRKDIFDKYSLAIKPGFFTNSETRTLYEKLNALHRQTGEDIPSSTFNGSLPEISDIDVAKALVEDFSVRCLVNTHQTELTRKLNQSSLLTQESISHLLPAINDHIVEEDMVEWDGSHDLRPRYPLDFGPLTDALAGGIRAGELVLIACPPWGGKTHFLTTFGAHYINAGHNVIHFILEDIPQDVAGYYATATRKTHIENLTLIDANSSIPTVPRFERFIKRLIKETDKPPVIIVDYLDIIADRCEDEVIRLRNICRDLRRVANKHKVLMFSARQSDAQAWDTPTPGLKNLSGSKIGTGAMADVILFFSQLEAEKNSGRGRIVIAKGRGRPCKQRVIPVIINWETFEIQYV